MISWDAMTFANRTEAGGMLAARLLELAGEQQGAPARLRIERPVVFALVRGGVPVAVEVARALRAPLEVLVARKLGARRNRELAVGAIAEGGMVVLDETLVQRTGTRGEQLARVLAREREELEQQVRRFRDGFPPAEVRGRTAIVVDDGLATGLTDLAAVRALCERAAGSVVVAVPVGSRQAVAMLREEADAVVCHTIPRELLGVGRWYEDFGEVTDARVLELLAGYGTRVPSAIG